MVRLRDRRWKPKKRKRDNLDKDERLQKFINEHYRLNDAKLYCDWWNYNFPNIDYHKNLSLGHQLLRFSFALDDKGESRLYTRRIYAESTRRVELREIMLRAPRVPIPWEEWLKLYDRLKNGSLNSFLKARRSSQRYIKPRNRRNPQHVLQAINAHGVVSEERSTLGEAMVMSHSGNEARGNIGLSHFEIRQIWHENKPIDPKEENYFADINMRYKWMKRLKKDLWSPGICEIFNNSRLFGLSPEPQKALIPSLTEIMLEQLRLSYFKQDWSKVVTCIHGIINENDGRGGSALHSQRHWIVWNAGMATIIRLESGFDALFQSLSQFGRDFCVLGSVVTYPLRLGVEVAVWLIQEGRYHEALTFLDSMENSNLPGSKNSTVSQLIDSTNPKRAIIDLLAAVIRAVNFYSCWKRDCNLHSIGNFDGSEEDLLKGAEYALSMLEKALSLAIKCEAEVTTFLDPLIELTLYCHPKERARELLDELVVKYYGNHYVEKTYEKFLEENFPNEKESACAPLKIGERFDFVNPSHWRRRKRIIASYKAKHLSYVTEMPYFDELPHPGFSW